MPGPFTTDSIPPQTGRVIVITGPTSGIGLETAQVLAGKGARVVLAARSAERTSAAMDRIRARAPDAQLESVSLDLASLDSVRAAAADLAARFPRIDVLINNAGIMAIPQRHSADGYELQMATNHLGHFALTGLLLPRIADRVVTVSSGAHRPGRIDLEHLVRPDPYRRWAVYSSTKLANLVFAYELQRRLARAGSKVKSIAIEPGFVNTNLQLVGPRMDHSAVMLVGARVAGALFGRTVKAGALPTLRAATDPDLPSGSYLAPRDRAGTPEPATSSAASRDTEMAGRLWERSEELTGVRFDL